MQAIIYELAAGVHLLVEAIAVLVVGVGSIVSLVALMRVELRGTPHGARKEVWRTFGMWLLFGLEFALAADIIGSIISPSWGEIGQLAAIAGIRTFLNHFLEQDLERAAEPTA